MSRARVKRGGGAHGPSLRVNPRETPEPEDIVQRKVKKENPRE